MKKIYCDLCEKQIPAYKDPIQVEMNDGEHPHCGSTMTKNVDCCEDCIQKIALRSFDEFDEIKYSIFSENLSGKKAQAQKMVDLEKVLNVVETEEELDGEIPESLKRLGEDSSNIEDLMRAAVRATKASLKGRIKDLS